MNLDDATRERISSLVKSNDVVLFMKGNRASPQCGFSAKVVKILDNFLPVYETFDVLADATVRDGIKEYSTWPTIPQLYIKGEFIGGCDIIQEIHASGELAEKLGIDFSDAEPPAIAISDSAAEALRRATADAPPDQTLHLGVDARYNTSLFLGPQSADEVCVTANGIAIRLDRLSASRAAEARIDVTQTPNGSGFQVHLPRAPEPVRQLSVQELKRMLDAGERFEFIDVRTPEERATASLPGTTLINEDVARRLESLPKTTVLVFHCHHGGRSQAAAEHFAGLGFAHVFNVAGGIDAWSREIDSDVPQY